MRPEPATTSRAVRAAAAPGTEQLAALGLGITVVNLGAREAARPYLQAIDDPSTAPDLLTPEDLSTIADGIAPWLERTQPSVQQSLVQLLRPVFDAASPATEEVISVIEGL